MPKNNILLGRAGEDAALKFLRNNGYKIICRNYRSKLGEIDIIANDKGVICFIEVKTRSSSQFGFPSEAILNSKQKKMCRIALAFLKEKKLFEKKARFDVVSVSYEAEEPEINLIKNAFELDGLYSY